MALGRYPEIPLAEARERRDGARKRLANGADPSCISTSQEDESTFPPTQSEEGETA